MTNEKALQYFRFKFDKAKNYYDEHWDATERREHREYVEALNCAIKALTENEELKAMLKIALYDIKQVSDDGCCYGCEYNKGNIQYGIGCQRFKRESNCYKWEHEEQALKLIRSDE